MFQTFTGNARRPRQVNLSGRATHQHTHQRPGGGTGTQNALVNAQQDRILRQQERDRTQAATKLQKTWRGHSTRKSIKDSQRRRWDEVESRVQDENAMAGVEQTHVGETEAVQYSSDGDALTQLGLLLMFVDLEDSQDLERFIRYYRRLLKTIDGDEDRCNTGPWPAAYLRLENTCLSALERPIPEAHIKRVLEVLKFAAARIPKETSRNSGNYFSALYPKVLAFEDGLDILCCPLFTISPTTISAYENFGSKILMKADLRERLFTDGRFDQLAGMINCKLLAKGVQRFLKEDNSWLESSSACRLALLTNFIYFYRHAHGFTMPERYVAGRDFVFIMSTLLSSLVDEIRVEPGLSDIEINLDGGYKSSSLQMADEFSRQQLLSLVTQESIAGLLARMGSDADGYQGSTEKSAPTNEQTRVLANYILTILRLFPRRGDEIRMWLYVGLSSKSDKSAGEESPVIEHFWHAARNTQVFEDIVKNSRTAVALLKTRRNKSRDEGKVPSATKTPFNLSSELDDQWRVILLFIELYLFILKIMDDEEFFSRSKTLKSQKLSIQHTNLLLEDIEDLVTFLKHLGFTMYYNAPEILGNSDDRDNADIRNFFRLGQSDNNLSYQSPTKRNQDYHIAGVHGMSLDHVKELVTGLLRAIYERDSRRPFLPKDHWLMTSRFDMSNFIDSVVEEEEKRKQVQDEDDDDEDDEGEGDKEDLSLISSRHMIGTRRALQVQRNERLQRQQRKASRRRFLQAVAPRQEILRNMPFLIPFTTRVQIFRRFIYLDQLKRRKGIVDPETWRMNVDMFEDPLTLQKHHAKIRRDFEFTDAYDQFYSLGAGLKEPISITFVDRFDQVEAGIDGGGVTKEFLTSVTNQAFAPVENDIQLFSENDQHLFYPNPSAVEEIKELLSEDGMKPDEPEFKAHVVKLLEKYEFLGRIIGKCLYEGILIDISFAGFFLLKWALTGGTGAAPQESSYRANLNDLRDFDEELYQGLLQLKNYAGDVEDFALNFTVTDTLKIPSDGWSVPHTKTLTRDLCHEGSSKPVTNANRPLYISYVARHRLTLQPAVQTSLFLRGLSSIIQPSWLSMFNQAELQTLVGGTASTISVADLRANTVYGGLYVIGDDRMEHPTVQLFWDVMEGLSEEEKGAVLKFVTSTPRAPLLGFSTLNPRFSIRDSGDDEARLPSTSTCVNLLKLPRYTRKDILKQKLLQAVSSGAGFDLS